MVFSVFAGRAISLCIMIDFIVFLYGLVLVDISSEKLFL